MKEVPFLTLDARHDVTYFWLLSSLCAKVVGATSSDGFLIPTEFCTKFFDRNVLHTI